MRKFIGSVILCSVFVLGVAFPNESLGQSALTPGNILISDLRSGDLTEITTSGAVVQSFNIPNVNSSFTDLRDIVVGSAGEVFAYSGTFDPTLATLTPSTGAITRDSFAGWATGNNITFGGIATLGDFVYVTDGLVTDGTFGIVRFDTQGGSTLRFGPRGYSDLTVGGNGLIYGLSVSGSEVDVFDPTSNQLVDTLRFSGTSNVRGIAVDRDGIIYASSFNEFVSSHDSQGNLINSFSFTAGGSRLDDDLGDLNINDNGDLIIGSRFGGLLVGDTSLTDFTIVDVNASSPVFTTFVTPLTVPEPVILGDVNMDGAVDFADIPALIAVLQSGEFQAEADTDLSETVDFGDIPTFIAILTGQ